MTTGSLRLLILLQSHTADVMSKSETMQWHINHLSKSMGLLAEGARTSHQLGMRFAPVESLPSPDIFPVFFWSRVGWLFPPPTFSFSFLPCYIKKNCSSASFLFLWRFSPCVMHGLCVCMCLHAYVCTCTHVFAHEYMGMHV